MEDARHGVRLRRCRWHGSAHAIEVDRERHAVVAFKLGVMEPMKVSVRRRLAVSIVPSDRGYVRMELGIKESKRMESSHRTQH